MDDHRPTPFSATRKPPLSIVAAVGRNGAIGQGNKLPWHMPTDLARFKKLTMGKPMVMGRRTYDSIGRALPGRDSIVVSGFDLDLPAGVVRAASPEAALDMARQRATARGSAEIMLIGGAVLFDDMMPEVDRLYLTYVDLAPKADAFFPTIDKSEWREVSRVTPTRAPNDDAACVFINFVRAR